MRVAERPSVRGRWHTVRTPDDLAGLPDADVVAVVRDPGAVWLASLGPALVAVVCTTGTPRSHVGIMAGNLGVPCVVAVELPEGPMPDGTEVEVDCSGDDGVIRA